jgi:hypothetical protein
VAQSPRESYLTLLERYEYNLALNSQWVLIIHGFPQIVKQQIAQLEAIRTNDWLLSDAYDDLTKQQVQSTTEVGCFFVDSVTLPDDRYNVVQAGNYNFGGFIKPGVAGQRDAFASKSIATSFRETNSDFVDFVIRPWVIVSSYNGYFAYQNANERVRAPRIQLISFGRQKHTPIAPYDTNTFRPIRKVYNFYNCAPFGVDGKKYSYNEDQGTPDLRSVTWCFDNYSVNVSNT